MKRILFILFIVLLFSGCDLRKREQELQKKENVLSQKEQELVLRERTLQLKEEALLKRTQRLDSVQNTSLQDSGSYNPDVVGSWDVTMNCTETNCTGSAVGDTKTENWTIFYQNKNVIAQATANKKLVRIYSGIYINDELRLKAQITDAAEQQNVAMIVLLRLTDNNHMEGRREINRAENCRIVYAINMVKQKELVTP